MCQATYSLRVLYLYRDIKDPRHVWRSSRRHIEHLGIRLEGKADEVEKVQATEEEEGGEGGRHHPSHAE